MSLLHEKREVARLADTGVQGRTVPPIVDVFPVSRPPISAHCFLAMEPHAAFVCAPSISKPYVSSSLKLVTLADKPHSNNVLRHRQESMTMAEAGQTTVSERTEACYAPVLILPGLGNASSDYTELSQKLLGRGHESVSVVPVRRWQWGQNAKGFLQRSYWTSTLTPDSVLDWYFSRVDRAVTELMGKCKGAKLNMVGHSAGGWLARAYIAERAPEGLQVSTLLTLGTPNRGPPDGTLDQTRGLLRYVEERCDVSKLVKDFVCVAGTGTVGKQLGKGSVSELVAYLSYAAVCGRGDVDGDGVTPVDAACARNAELVLCEHCDHSMLTSQKWYGSDNAFSNWARYLC